MKLLHHIWKRVSSVEQFIVAVEKGEKRKKRITAKQASSVKWVAKLEVGRERLQRYLNWLHVR